MNVWLLITFSVILFFVLVFRLHFGSRPSGSAVLGAALCAARVGRRVAVVGRSLAAGRGVHGAGERGADDGERIGVSRQESGPFVHHLLAPFHANALQFGQQQGLRCFSNLIIIKSLLIELTLSKTKKKSF